MYGTLLVRTFSVGTQISNEWGTSYGREPDAAWRVSCVCVYEFGQVCKRSLGEHQSIQCRLHKALNQEISWPIGKDLENTKKERTQTIRRVPKDLAEWWPLPAEAKCTCNLSCKFKTGNVLYHKCSLLFSYKHCTSRTCRETVIGDKGLQHELFSTSTCEDIFWQRFLNKVEVTGPYDENASGVQQKYFYRYR